MDSYAFSSTTWRKSRHSAAVNCVEVAQTSTVIGVRDSKDRGGPVLQYPTRQWSDFLDGAKNGDFDRREAGLGR